MRILLLGAGFSANWGGPLARNMFDWLLQYPEVKNEARLKALLWEHRASGGFENALSQVQTDYQLSQTTENKARLESFQNAINNLFADLDNGFSHLVTWDFNNEAGHMLVDFLVQFDAIFTLNQDLLFERFYLNNSVALASRQRWNGCVIPGMRTLLNTTPLDVGKTIWVPDPDNFNVPQRNQPYFKLHGSYRWQDTTGKKLMIIGGSKSVALQSHKILQWYFSEFERYLKMGTTKLMVIGYGFADTHINDAILAGEQTGLRMFIVDPLGVDAANPDRKLPLKRQNPFQNIIESTSQILLSQSFGDNLIEHSRLIKFLK